MATDLTKKSPFRVLLEQARDLGIKKINFAVDVDKYTEDEKVRWIAWSSDVDCGNWFRGTNGQHALTELIAAKREELRLAQTNQK